MYKLQSFFLGDVFSNKIDTVSRLLAFISTLNIETDNFFSDNNKFDNSIHVAVYLYRFRQVQSLKIERYYILFEKRNKLLLKDTLILREPHCAKHNITFDLKNNVVEICAYTYRTSWCKIRLKPNYVRFRMNLLYGFVMCSFDI